MEPLHVRASDAHATAAFTNGNTKDAAHERKPSHPSNIK